MNCLISFSWLINIDFFYNPGITKKKETKKRLMRLILTPDCNNTNKSSHHIEVLTQWYELLLSTSLVAYSYSFIFYLFIFWMMFFWYNQVHNYLLDLFSLHLMFIWLNGMKLEPTYNKLQLAALSYMCQIVRPCELFKFVFCVHLIYLVETFTNGTLSKLCYKAN